MSSGFAELMKLSQSQTAQSEQAVETQIAAHRSQLEKKRKEQEAKDKREREMAAKLRLKRLEEQRLEEERKQKRLEEEAARRKGLEQREAHARDALKYGPKKAASISASRSKAGDKGDLSDDDPSTALTRVEKRERKLAAQLRRAGGSTHGSRRSGSSLRTTSLPDGRVVRRLPGGAVDVTIASRLADPESAAAAIAIPSDLANKGVRERLTAMPVGLMKLNTVKRDVRTIDEILTDRAKVKATKVLDGDDAKEFSDWFGKGKKKEKNVQPSLPQPRASPLRHSSDGPSRAVSATSSGSQSPAPTSHVNPFAGSAISTAPKIKSSPVSSGGSSFFKPINPKPSAARLNNTAKVLTVKKRPRSPSPPPVAPTKRRLVGAGVSSSASARVSVSSRPKASSHAAASASLRPTGKSGSRSDSDTYAESESEVKKTLMELFGPKKTYVDVFSDEEDLDMEADARAVLKEEARSARLAYKEDEAALAEQRRREEEKRRRKKERERRERS